MRFVGCRLLGHEVAPQAIKATVPALLSAPGLPELNPPQLAAVAAVLAAPLSLIQGPPGTGKTVTSASIVYHLARQAQGQARACTLSHFSSAAVGSLGRLMRFCLPMSCSSIASG